MNFLQDDGLTTTKDELSCAGSKFNNLNVIRIQLIPGLFIKLSILRKYTRSPSCAGFDEEATLLGQLSYHQS